MNLMKQAEVVGALVALDYEQKMDDGVRLVELVDV